MATLQLRLSGGTEAYGGFNAKIALPKGVNVTGVTAGELTPPGFAIDHRVSEDAANVWLAVVAYSSAAAITGTDGVLLDIALQVTDAASAGTHAIGFATSNPDPAINSMHAISDVHGARSVGHSVLGMQMTIASPLDTDGDGIPDATDTDDDNDGVADDTDAFPFDPTEWEDYPDHDGIGNNADPDDDNDGYLDGDDPDPRDASVVPAAGIGVWSPPSRRFFLDLDASLSFSLPADAMTDPFGSVTDYPVTGDWNGDGFDELGVWNPTSRRFFLDLNGDDRWTSPAVDVMTAGYGSSDCWPLAGDWLGEGLDRIGVWCPKSRRFFLDADGTGAWSAGDIMTPPFGSGDSVPVTGDWDGDGIDRIGVWDPRSRRFYLDLDGDYRWTTGGDLVTVPFGSSDCLPLADDWNGDRIDEIGVWCPNSRRFFLDCDGSDAWSAGDCMSVPFGNFDSEPVSGRW